MTNRERFRSMTEKELIEYLGNGAFCHSISHCRDKNCETCIEKWLDEEEEVGGMNEN